GSEVVVEGDVLLEDHHDVADRRARVALKLEEPVMLAVMAQSARGRGRCGQHAAPRHGGRRAQESNEAPSPPQTLLFGRLRDPGSRWTLGRVPTLFRAGRSAELPDCDGLVAEW